MSIKRLTKKYAKVQVVILDYPDRKYSPQYVKKYLDELFDYGNVAVSINSDHFGKISRDAIGKYLFDVYASGNHMCLNHVRKLGYEVEYVERAYDWTATDDRIVKTVMEALNG
jgi:hypothetical protein